MHWIKKCKSSCQSLPEEDILNYFVVIYCLTGTHISIKSFISQHVLP